MLAVNINGRDMVPPRLDGKPELEGLDMDWVLKPDERRLVVAIPALPVIVSPLI